MSQNVVGDNLNKYEERLDQYFLLNYFKEDKKNNFSGL